MEKEMQKVAILNSLLTPEEQIQALLNMNQICEVRDETSSEC